MDGKLAEILGRLELIRAKISELSQERRRLRASFHEAVLQLAEATSQVTDAKAAAERNRRRNAG